MTPQAFAAVMDRAYTEMRPWSASEIAATLDHDSTVFLSEEAGGLLAQITADECEILVLATDPGAQRTGIATRLLNALVERATARGVTRILLEVASRNGPARAFYAAQGFGQVGLRKGYYTLRDGSRDDALLLSRPVPLGHVPDQPRTESPVAKSG